MPRIWLTAIVELAEALVAAVSGSAVAWIERGAKRLKRASRPIVLRIVISLGR